MNKELFRQFIRFCLVGVLNTLLDFAVYWFLTRSLGMYFFYANFISVLVAMSFSFVMNKFWTFSNFNKNIKKQYLQFAAVNLIYYILNNAIIFLGVNYLLIGDLWAKVLSTAIGLIWSFGANKVWTFRE